jgi:6-phosphofructokinase 1
MGRFDIKTLGEPRIASPLVKHKLLAALGEFAFIRDSQRVLKNVSVSVLDEKAPESFEKAGARERIYFQPGKTKVAIVTCGGICPGLNDVIRALVLNLHYFYGVSDIKGVRYGYAGLGEDPPAPPIDLSPKLVSQIHDLGGTMLGSSRGAPTPSEIVDTLEKMDIDILFCIGGDGTLRGAHDIYEEVESRKLSIAVLGIPKTIDNDIAYVYRCFGFQTAVAEAKKTLSCAHVEAKCAPNGIGLVKLMGRDAGYIAAAATKASGDVNFCLVPEAKFPLEGENGLISVLHKRLLDRGHALIAVAEGAGTDIVGEGSLKDASGNLLHNDIGIFLKEKIKSGLSEKGMKPSIKYIDPSYIIRSVPANADDSIFCADLARAAVNAAMAGKTDMLVGYWHGEFTHVPLKAIRHEKKCIEIGQLIWKSVLATTGQPPEWI